MLPPRYCVARVVSDEFYATGNAMSEISHVKPNSASIEQFFDKIEGSWHKTIESILETAQAIKQAQEQHSSDDLGVLKRQLVQKRVMSKSTFSKLKGIGNSKVLNAPEHRQKLPTSYATLYAISKREAE